MSRIGLIVVILMLVGIATACGTGEPSYTAYVWEDKDGDGRQGEDEEPIAGIVLQIIDKLTSTERPVDDYRDATLLRDRQQSFFSLAIEDVVAELDEVERLRSQDLFQFIMASPM